MKARIASAWPLWSVLAAQLALTLPWLWRTAPFSDEALYLEAGHQEWAHWLHHAALPDFSSWFSGAPVVYPPIAAAADSAGGLVAARVLSLTFMLATTALIYLIGSRRFGRLAGVLGSLLFAVSGLVVHSGALATFDPMALLLLVTAAWAGIRARDGGSGWLAACALALVAANATKYATLAWDPLILAIIVLHGWDAIRWRAVGLAASVAVTVGVLDLGLLTLAGPSAARGLVVTTIFRSIHTGPSSSAAGVLAHALAMTGLIALTSAAGLVVSVVRRLPWSATAFLSLLVTAALLAPAGQARLHQISSLDRNMGYGLAFAAIGAGYALSAVIEWLSPRLRHGKLVTVAVAIVLVLAVAIAGRLQRVQFRGPGIAVANQVVSTIGSHYRQGTFILSDGAARMEQYYLPDIPPRAWVPTFTPSQEQRQRIQDQICTGQISVVVLRKRGSTFDHPYDRAIVAMLGLSKRFTLKTVAGAVGKTTTRVWVSRGPGTKNGAC